MMRLSVEPGLTSSSNNHVHWFRYHRKWIMQYINQSDQQTIVGLSRLPDIQ